jgi:hypothetical protein
VAAVPPPIIKTVSSVYFAHSDGKVTVTSDTISVTRTGSAIRVASGDVTISGGTISVPNGRTVNNAGTGTMEINWSGVATGATFDPLPKTDNQGTAWSGNNIIWTPQL